jgi:hypothetical protein
MNTARILAALALAAPLAAAAQPTYSYTKIIGERAYFVDNLRVCEARNDRLWDRTTLIEQDRYNLARADHSIAQIRAELENERRALDRTNVAAVDAYNTRSYALNRWVAAHNRRVEELNGAAALLTADARQLVAYCDNLYVARR